MDYAWTLYLITRLDEVKGTLVAFAVVAALTMLFAGLLCLASKGCDDEWSKRFATALKPALIVFAVCCSTNILIPSQKDAMFIAGGVAVIEAAKSDTAQRLASKSIVAIESWLDAANIKEKKQ